MAIYSIVMHPGYPRAWEVPGTVELKYHDCPSNALVVRGFSFCQTSIAGEVLRGVGAIGGILPEYFGHITGLCREKNQS